jgi:hypothetical protein
MRCRRSTHILGRVTGLAAPSSLPRRTDPDWEDELARILAGSASFPAAAKQAICDVLEAILREEEHDEALAEPARAVLAALSARPEHGARPEARSKFVPLPAV